MEKLRKILAGLLVTVLLVSLLPTSAFADGPEDGVAIDVIFMSGGVQYDRKSVQAGTSVSNWPEDPAAPDGLVTEDGDAYEFAGWADNDGNFYTRESIFIETITLTAQWKTPDRFTVSFQDRYGKLINSNSRLHGSTLSEYEGFALYDDDPAFIGWFDGTTQISGTQEITEDTVVHAVFSVTVTFLDQDGKELERDTRASGTVFASFDGFDYYSGNSEFVAWRNGQNYYPGETAIYEDLTVSSLLRTMQDGYPVYIGNTGYLTLQAAFDAAGDGDVIDLEADIEIEGTTLTPASLISITLNLNGKTITNNSSNYAIDIYAPVNLTITGNGSIISDENECIDVESDAAGTSLVIDGLTLISENSYGIYMSYDDETKRNSLWVKNADISSYDECLDVGDYADVVIDGGSFHASRYQALEMGSYCTLTINSGTFISDDDYTLDADDNNSIVIYDGIFKSNDDYALYIGDYNSVTIHNGTFESDDDYAVEADDNNNIVIHDGIFKGYYDAVYIDEDGDGYLIINNGSFYSQEGHALYTYTTGNVTVNGGNFTSQMDCALYKGGSGNITVNGGVFRSSADDEAAFECGNGTATINGGEFYSVADDYAAVYQDGADLLVINGGIFNASKYYAIEAYDPVEIHAGTFTGNKGGLIAADDVTLYGGTYSSTDGASPALVDNGPGYITIAEDYAASPQDWESATHVIIAPEGLLPEMPELFYTVTYMDADGNELSSTQAADGAVLGNIAGFDHYAEDIAFMFWKDQLGNVVNAQTIVDKELTLSPVFTSADALVVHSTEELNEKLADPSVTTIILGEPHDETSYDVDNTIQVDHSVAIIGNGITLNRGAVCTDAVFQVSGETTVASLVGMMIDGNHVASQRAAVIALSGSTLELTNVTIENCINTTTEINSFQTEYPVPAFGGAISGCGIYDNSSNYYYGYLGRAQTTISINGCVLKYNTADRGGAVSVGEDVRFTIANTEIYGNRAETYGGGLYLYGCRRVGCVSYDLYNNTINNLTNIRISGNTADAGGGIYLESICGLTTSNVLVYNNTAYQGGGLWAGVTYHARQDFTGTDFWGNRAQENLGDAVDAGGHDPVPGGCEPYYTTNSIGDDVFDINRNTSSIGSRRKYKNPLPGENCGSIEKESRANATVPFTDENGDTEEIPGNTLIPFYSWFEDGDYYSAVRYEHLLDSVDIPNGSNDFKLDPEYFWQFYSACYGMKAVYFGYLVKYMPNHPEYENGDVQRYDDTAYLPDATVRVKSNDGFTDFSWPNHAFKGWNTEADGTGDWFGPKFQIRENTILYAIWEPTVAAFGSLTVSKEVTGIGDKTKDFTFKVTLSDEFLTGTFGEMEFVNGVAEFTLKDGESKTAVGLPANTVYTVKEDDNDGYTTTVNQISSDTLRGTVIADNAWEVHYINHIPKPYEPKAAEVILRAEKTLDGTAPSGSDYTFVLKDSDGNILQTVNNIGGNVTFAAMNFNAEGVYEYTISEQSGSDSSINYDSTAYKVIVQVTREVDYTAIVTYEIDGQAYNGVPVFANTTRSASDPDEPTNPDTPTDPTVPTGPDTPPDPTLPTEPDTPVKPDKVPQTGDTSHTGLWLLLVLVSLTGMVICLVMKRRTERRTK